MVFGGYVASKAIGFADLYPTAAARQKIAESFSSNVGIELLLGKAPHDATTAAYAAWNTGGVMVIIGSIWALLLATKYFRGEEGSGRQEVLLSGQTTARRAVSNIFAGFGASLSVFYVVMAALFMAVGKSHGVDYGAGAALFFALTVILGITLFMMVGALASQLMPTRGRAAGTTAVVLGISYLLRALGDVTSARWLLNVTPLGWIEKAQPLSTSQPLWLIPITGLSVILGLLTIYFAGKRDLGDSIIADKATARPRLGLLNSPFSVALRLNRTSSLGWLSGTFILSFLYGLITKSTAQAFNQSASFSKVIDRLAQQARLSSALAFLGIVFLLQMIIIMAYAANAMAAIRREEAEGYLDNFLVRPVSRTRWLSGRIFLSMIVIICAGLLTIAGVWLGIVNQHLGISLHTLFLASVNAIIPAILTIGVGTFAFGIVPRFTAVLAYAVLAWSFLVEMVSSGLKLNHWILDTSVLHQVVLAPAANPRWSTNAIIVCLAVILCVIGATLFNRRDLAAE
jgi:ABC-2 type transport system permease protein